MIVLLAGLPGVGKSTAAARLAGPLEAVIVDRDDIKERVIPHRYLTHSSLQTRFAGDVAFKVVEAILSENSSPKILVDGHTFSRTTDIERYRSLCVRFEASLFVVLCTAQEDVIRHRIIADHVGIAKERTWEKYLEVRTRFEPIPGNVIHLDLSDDDPDFSPVVRTILDDQERYE